MLSKSTPRVNFELMERFINSKVLLVGQIDQPEAGRARIRAADGGTVTVELADNTPISSQFVEFRGIVTSAATLKEETRTELGDKFEVSTYNELCKLIADYPNLYA